MEGYLVMYRELCNFIIEILLSSKLPNGTRKLPEVFRIVLRAFFSKKQAPLIN